MHRASNPTPVGSRVLIVLDASSAWSRGILRGFTEVAHGRAWTLLHYHPNVDLRWLVEVWEPRVVVLQRGQHLEAADALESCAVVSVNDDQSAAGVPSVCLDDEKVGKLAAAHLLGKGLRAFATFRFNDGAFAVARDRGFREDVTAAGATLARGWGDDPATAHEDPEVLASWLAGLPRPCGVFACTDSWARVVARYAQVTGIRIPEDLALIGVDNDTVDCELSSPPLSSVAVPWRTVGEKAAWLVGRTVSGVCTAGERIVVDPVDVIPRRSTDVAAVQDPIVARAMSWISGRAARRLTLQEIARASACSRQRLEQRFHAALGRTVMQEVRRVRVDAAKRLLSTTTLSLPAVAQRTGFTSAALLSVAFRRETGMPPGAYRRQLRGLHSKEE